MNNEFITQLESLEHERGISREVLLDSIEKAIASAIRKDTQTLGLVEVKINPKNGEMKAYIKQEVIAGNAPHDGQISLEKAKEINPDAKEGEIIQSEFKTRNLGRIAAQTARQVMLQQLRRAEKAIVQDEFKEKLQQIVSGTVKRIESGDIIVDFQKAEGKLSKNDQIPKEKYGNGDRINAILMEIERGGSGPSLILSRACTEFVKKLFEREVSEIHNGIVEIKAVAREAGSRTKIAVISKDPHIDPIGACVGIKGMRVKNVMNELSGEKIDIVHYDEDIRNFVTQALQPATVKKIEIDENEKIVNVSVAPEQFALALGKKGQNVRLTSKLVNRRVNITALKDEETFEKKLEEAITLLAETLKVNYEIAGKLVKSGYLTIEGLFAADPNDLRKIDGISSEEIEALIKSIEKQESNENPA